MKKSWLGPLLVGIGSLFWATDALVRVPAIASQNPSFLVFVEHFIGVLVLIPWVFLRLGRKGFRLGSWSNWLACLIVGAGGSALALLLFTEAFQFLNPTLNILIQKTQPIAVVLIAYWILGEKPTRHFYLWAALALGACIALNVFESDSHNSSGNTSLTKGILLSLGASLVWAISTVTGKKLLLEVDPLLATFWRFVFGLLTLVIILLLDSTPTQWQGLWAPEYRWVFLYLGIFPGVLAMWTYYEGMKKTSATTTTFVELIFPVGSIILNYFFLGSRLNATQIALSAALLFAVTRISLLQTQETS
jgi:drug/metabolite transporter (DMT)-like permease